MVPKIVVTDELDWKDSPKVSFQQRSSLTIAIWILIIFSIVYVLCFGIAFYMISIKAATFDNCLELLKFLLGSIIPLATLAVGYYLGERDR